ncbi:MAG: sugar transporter substrate-binding protein, partial [Ilumatobacteraceae bacterium]|nr:sugar transporter substrate-binding protein [Ilumatobacteraceae bacterium]
MVGTFILASCGSDSKSSSSTAAATTVASTATTTAAGGSTAESTATTGGASGSGTIGVILPDSKSSVRWETADRKYLEAAITAAGFTADIQNA